MIQYIILLLSYGNWGQNNFKNAEIHVLSVFVSPFSITESMFRECELNWNKWINLENIYWALCL